MGLRQPAQLKYVGHIGQGGWQVSTVKRAQTAYKPAQWKQDGRGWRAMSRPAWRTAIAMLSL